MRGGRAVKLHVLKPSETVRGSRPRGSSRPGIARILRSGDSHANKHEKKMRRSLCTVNEERKTNEKKDEKEEIQSRDRHGIFEIV